MAFLSRLESRMGTYRTMTRFTLSRTEALAAVDQLFLPALRYRSCEQTQSPDLADERPLSPLSMTSDRRTLAK